MVCIDRLMEAESRSVISAFENRIKNLEGEKLERKEKIARCGRPAADYDKTYRAALEFLENPYKLWVSEHIIDKQTFLKLVFEGDLVYVRNGGFGTAEMSVPFKFINDLVGSDSDESEMVRYP